MTDNRALIAERWARAEPPAAYIEAQVEALERQMAEIKHHRRRVALLLSLFVGVLVAGAVLFQATASGQEPTECPVTADPWPGEGWVGHWDPAGEPTMFDAFVADTYWIVEVCVATTSGDVEFYDVAPTHATTVAASTGDPIDHFSLRKVQTPPTTTTSSTVPETTTTVPETTTTIVDTTTTSVPSTSTTEGTAPPTSTTAPGPVGSAPPAPGPGAPSLADTGASVRGWLIAAAVALCVGALCLAAGNKLDEHARRRGAK